MLEFLLLLAIVYYVVAYFAITYGWLEDAPILHRPVKLSFLGPYFVFICLAGIFMWLKNAVEPIVAGDRG